MSWDRRGQVSNQTIRFIMGIIYLIAVLTAITGLIIMNTPTEVKTGEAEMRLLVLRLLNDPAIAWVDPLTHHQRTLVLDGQKLSRTELLDAVTYPRGLLAAKIKLDTTTLFYDRDTFRRHIEQIAIKGGPIYAKFELPLIIRDGMTDRIVLTEIEVVRS
ncbi:hypothetical protein HY641_04000 [Candidatus Woesearchaeota archaeon]|nr:hypothetical protein [Candidatus Woesearchaeota archaeon]